ncbi:MAG: gamma subclass chorismate mutase AroQ [Nostoc sp.]|uniref:gamma subclass chorismate mutase AroQ n=1 Tax=Nostoc sp. TaxID=1180 RepID=UPI002FF82ECB
MNLNSYKKILVFQVIIITFALILTSKPSFGQSKENSQESPIVVCQASRVALYQKQIDKLLSLIQQRLLIQSFVAQWKWNHNNAIEAPEREQVLLAQLRKQAPAYGLDPDVVVVFFQWQIFAGKLIQISNFQSWQKQGIEFFDNVPDLNRTLRPSLDKLSPEILSALATLSPVLNCPILQQIIQSRAQIILRGDAIDDTVRRIAIAPLIELKGISCRDIPGLDIKN